MIAVPISTDALRLHCFVREHLQVVVCCRWRCARWVWQLGGQTRAPCEAAVIFTMDAVTEQLDDMESTVSGMHAQQKAAQRRVAYPQTSSPGKGKKKKKKDPNADLVDTEAEAEAQALLARARRLVDAAKGIELPDFSQLFKYVVLSAHPPCCSCG